MNDSEPRKPQLDDLPIRACAACLQPVPRNATRCPWCGHSVEHEPALNPYARLEEGGFLYGRAQRSRIKVICAVAVTMVAAFFLLAAIPAFGVWVGGGLIVLVVVAYVLYITHVWTDYLAGTMIGHLSGRRGREARARLGLRGEDGDDRLIKM